VFTFVAAETPSNLVAVTAISAAVFFVGDPNETYREWNVESQASPDGLAARIGRFGGTDLTVSAGQRRCANPAAHPNCRSRRRSCRGPLVAM
jgi:hypothetical protein